MRIEAGKRLGVDFYGKLGSLSIAVASVILNEPCWLEIVEGTDAATVTAIQAIIDAYTPPDALTEAQAAKLTEISAACDAALAPLTKSYPDNEVKSWPQQIAEATSLASDSNAAAPLIRQMAASRPSLGETDAERVAELARRIRQNAADWAAMAGPIIGKRQALVDLVDAADTPEAVAAIVVNFGSVS